MTIGRPLRHNKSVQRFFAGETPEAVFDSWASELAALGIEPRSIPRTITIHAPRRSWLDYSCDDEIVPGFFPPLGWWPRANVDDEQRKFQTWSAQHEGLPPEDVSVPSLVPSCIDLLRGLWLAQGDVEAIGAVLIGASLRARINHPSSYPQDWPSIDSSSRLLRWAKQRFPWAGRGVLHRHGRENGGATITNMSGFIRALAVEHARVLHQWTPVRITFRMAAEPSTLPIVTEAEERLSGENPVDESSKCAQEVARTLGGPSPNRPIDPAQTTRDSWDSLTKPELERLIWSKTQIEVAKEYGVSGAAVCKRCKSWGIKKPERGYWQKTNAGQIQFRVPLVNSSEDE